MSILDQLKKAMSPEAFAELEKASANMKLADLSTGEYVSKGKHEGEVKELNSKIETLTAQAQETSAEMEKLSKSGATVEGLQKQIQTMQENHKEALQELERTNANDKKMFAVKAALSAAGAHDPDLAFTALGVDLDKLEYGENNTIIGLSDRIKGLQETKHFLWKETKPANGHLPTDPKGAPSQEERVSGMLKATGFVEK